LLGAIPNDYIIRGVVRILENIGMISKAVGRSVGQAVGGVNSNKLPASNYQLSKLSDLTTSD